MKRLVVVDIELLHIVANMLPAQRGTDNALYAVIAGE